MPVQQQPRPKNVHETAESGKTGVRGIVPVVDAQRRRVRHQNIQIAAVAQAVSRQLGRQAEHMANHFGLGMLVPNIPVIAPAAGAAGSAGQVAE